MNLRKDVAAGILIAMSIGMIGNALALWRDSAVMTERISTVEKKQEKQDNEYSKLQEQVNEMHWYLIRSKKIAVPPEDN